MHLGASGFEIVAQNQRNFREHDVALTQTQKNVDHAGKPALRNKFGSISLDQAFGDISTISAVATGVIADAPNRKKNPK